MPKACIESTRRRCASLSATPFGVEFPERSYPVVFVAALLDHRLL